jgi:hypothetical protein
VALFVAKLPQERDEWRGYPLPSLRKDDGPMTDLDDLPFVHDDGRLPNGATGRRPPKGDDPERARRGRTARARGNAFEREVAAKLGGRRVGQYGDKVDVDVPGYLRVQCKNGAAYSERLDAWLRAIPVEAGILRAVVLGDAPGPGRKRRAIIVFDLDEYAAWHGR